MAPKSTSKSTSTPIKSHFLTLPIELRVSIYDTLIHTSVTINLRKHKRGHQRPFKALRNTCAKIKAEVDDYLSSKKSLNFHKNFGVFDPNTTSFYLGLSERKSYFEGVLKMLSDAPPYFQKGGVRHLIVDVEECDLMYTTYYEGHLLDLIMLCPNLQSLYLTINDCDSASGTPKYPRQQTERYTISLQNILYHKNTRTGNTPPIDFPRLFTICDGRRAKSLPRRPKKKEIRTVTKGRVDVIQAWDFNFLIRDWEAPGLYYLW